jgi:PAS domain S-box-containing protein
MNQDTRSTPELNRTEEQLLAQREAELAVLSRVQQALADRMTIQEIYEVLGETIRGIFDAQSVIIGTYDPVEPQATIHYWWEKGERYYPGRVPLSGIMRYMLEQKKILVINRNFLEWSQEIGVTVSEGEHSKSGVFVPLAIGDNVFGAISLQNIDREDAFSDTDVRLLETLASSMSLALENARLFDETSRLLEETEQRNAELTIVNTIGEGLASRLEFKAVIDLVGDRVQEIFQADTTYIALYDPATNMGSAPYYVERGHRHEVPPRPLGEGLWSEVIRTREAKLFGRMIDQTGGTPQESPGAGADLNESYLGVPILVGADVIGVLSVQCYQQHAFNESDLRLLSTIAANMGVALESARLFDETNRLLTETEERNAELAVINKIQEGLVARVDMQSIYDLVGDKIREIFDAQVVTINALDIKNRINHYQYVWEKGVKEPEFSVPFVPLIDDLIQEQRTMIYNEGVEELIQAGKIVIHRGAPPSSFVLVVMLSGGQVSGYVSLQNIDKEHVFSDSDVSLLTTIVNSLGIALENARLFDESQSLLEETNQRNVELETINTISQALVAETELDALIQLTGEQMRQTFQADIVYVALLDPRTCLIHFPYTYGESFGTIQLGEGLTSKILESGQPLLINEDFDTQRQQMGVDLVGRRAASYLGVPIIVGKQTIGVISVQSTEQEGCFTENDVRLLSTLAANVATAINNARLFDDISRQKNYYETIIANSPAAIVVINPRLIVTSWNPAAERLFGYTPEEAIGQDVDSLVANQPEVYDEARELSERGLRDKYVHFFSRRTRKDRSFVDVEVLGLPVIVDGEISEYVVIYHDITELEHARQQAIEANRAKSTFLANMSHELRTPLNAIIGFTRIVKRKGRDSLPGRQVENLDKVLVSAEHLLDLINTILDISKIEAGRVDVKLSTFEIEPLVDLCLTTSQPLVKEDRVKLSRDIQGPIPPLCSDQDKVKQILLNLISNAAKFTHQGEIVVRAWAEDQLLNLAVEDTGIGISEGALETIFEEFQQADTSTSREYGGTGLGLSISRSLAQLLGGDISVESEVGRGTTFTVSIPLIYEEIGISQEVQRAELAGMTDDAPDAPLILVIDDNPDVFYLMQENLAEAGYQVVGALSGDDGLAKARELNPFTITLDIMMPVKDGWQVLHELKADPRTRSIPVVLLTIVDKKALGYHLGAADYLVKPIEEAALLEVFNRLAEPGTIRQPERILVVDDDPHVFDMVRELLEETDYTVDCAVNGIEALEAIRQESPDAVLLDLLMPELDGFGVLEQLAQNPQYRDIPVIVLTAKTLTSAEEQELNRRVTQVIEKRGLSEENLIHEIRTAIEQGGEKG